MPRFDILHKGRSRITVIIADVNESEQDAGKDAGPEAYGLGFYFKNFS